MTSHIIDVNTPVRLLRVRTAWEQLTPQEQRYAYFLAKACWEGSKISVFQRSHESPGLFILLQACFLSAPLATLQTQLAEQGVTADEWQQFLAFAAGVITNCGNYRGFGDTKIVPELSPVRLEFLLQAFRIPLVTRLHKKIAAAIYDLSPSCRHLALGSSSAYYSKGIDREQAFEVSHALRPLGVAELNTRLMLVNDQLEIKQASVQTTVQQLVTTQTGQSVSVRNGDFSAVLLQVVQYLAQALPYTQTEEERSMLVEYICHFCTGDMEAHRRAQIAWVQNTSPVVEYNIGFIERYSDPLALRAEFEGFVSIVNKELSTKLNTLTTYALSILALLPWHPQIAEFSVTSFSSLDVITFACSGLPIGINLPNYDDIRVQHGFKNVSLANVFSAAKATDFAQLPEAHAILAASHAETAESFTVALHELFGHGNVEVYKYKPETQEQISEAANWAGVEHDWVAQECWDGKYGTAFEECKAEAVALYLTCFAECHQAFGTKDCEGVTTTAWLLMAHKGLMGLLYYDPTSRVWGQAHCWARFVILQVLLKSGLATLQLTEESVTLLLDPSQIKTVGLRAISQYLWRVYAFQHLEGNRGKELFRYYSELTPELLQAREVLVAQQKPRRCVVQSNILESGALVEYPETFEGVVQAFIDRFPTLDEAMLQQWEAEYYQEE